MDILLLVACLIFGVSYLCIALLRWNKMKYRGAGLPPGTMGWPIFGETFEFRDKGPEFMKRQCARYGSVFKTHILGSPTVVSMDPELNRYILMNESKGLVPGYPQASLDILGERNIAAVTGSYHKRMRGSLLLVIGSPALRVQVLPKADRDMRCFLQNWDAKTIDFQQKACDMAFIMHLKHIMEEEADSICGTLKEEFDKLTKGTLSLPINIPGTNYYRGIKARKNVIKLIRKTIENRKASSSKTHDDILNSLINGADKKYELDDKERDDQIITILNSGFETVSRTTMMILKYLHEDPKALEELKDEHFKIRQEKSKDEPIDWNEFKNMKFTHAVIYETLRLATIVNGVLRKTTKDVELKGFHIPKGWRIYVYTRELNYDLNLYSDPLKFNPWRWMENERLENHEYYFAFGGGTRLCPGKELGTLTISLFLHYFLTTYKWELIGDQDIRVFPRVEATNGFYMKVSKC